MTRPIGTEINYRPNLSKMQLTLRQVQVPPQGFQGTLTQRGRDILLHQGRRRNPHLAR